MLTEAQIDGKRCFFDISPNAPTLLVQAVDSHDLDGLENEIKSIRSLTAQRFSLAAFLVENWNDELSPWPAPPVFSKQGFGGQGEATLAFLTDTLLPQFQERLSPSALYIGGYSLSGLFALWAASRTDAFQGAAGCSPSVWFPGWIEYAQAHPLRAPRVYLSLGDREEKTRNPVMARVGDCVRAQYALLQSQANPIDCALEWNPGNHFVDAAQRTAKGFAWLLKRRISTGEAP